jgi:hypothetical protein
MMDFFVNSIGGSSGASHHVWKMTEVMSSPQSKAGRHKASPYKKCCSVGAIPCGRPDLSQNATRLETHPCSSLPWEFQRVA